MKTGAQPELMQDDCRALSIWFATRLGARHLLQRNFEMTPVQATTIRALEQYRGDDLERFKARYARAPAEWWDKPAPWNPCMTPREYLDQQEARDRLVTAAIEWVKSSPAP